MTEQNPTILYADSTLLVIDKPPGILSIPDGYDHTVPYLGRILESAYGRLWVVHRLDKETSGAMVFARNPDVHSKLNAQFAKHQVLKTYHAIIFGSPDWNQKVSDVPLRANVGHRNRTAVDVARGKHAQTHFLVLEKFPEHSLVEAKPETGRTHQIRAHLYDLGFSILSDSLYGYEEKSPFIGRLALHACTLTFWHPTTGEMVNFVAPYPKDFELALSQLRSVT